MQVASSESDFKEALSAMEDAYKAVQVSGDKEKQLEVLSDLVPLLLRSGDYERCPILAIEAVQIAKDLKNKEKEALFNLYLAMYYTELGDNDHASVHINDGLTLSEGIKDSEFSLRYLKGNLLAILFNKGEFSSVIKTGRSVIASIGPEEKSSKRGDAVYAQVAALLACSYQVLVNEEKATPEQLDSAVYFENEYNSTAYAERDKGHKLRNYYVASSQNEKARSLLMGELEELSSSDTINVRYYRALKALAGTYKNEGQYKDAYDFQSRAINIKDTLDRLDLIKKTYDYQLQMNSAKSEWEIRKQKQSSRVFSALFAFAILIIFVLVLYVILNARKARELQRKNKMLAVSVASGALKDEIISRLSSSENTEADESLYFYRQIERITEEKKLYLDRGITREMLLQEYGVPKAKLPGVLTKYAGVATLNEYINAKRLSHAAALMVENPNMKLMDVALNSGFSNTTTMYRLFIKNFDMSPSEYVKRYHSAEQEEEKGINGGA